MPDWDYNDEHHTQARRTFGMIQRALSQNTRRSFTSLEESQTWLAQLNQSIDELTYLIHEQRFTFRLRMEARILRDAVRTEIQRAEILIQKIEQRPQAIPIEKEPLAREVRAQSTEQPITQPMAEKPKSKSEPAISAKHAAQILVVIHEKQVTRGGIPLGSLDRSQLMVRRAVVGKNIALITKILGSPRITMGVDNEAQEVLQTLAKERREIDRLLTEGHDERVTKQAIRPHPRPKTRTDVPHPPQVKHVPFVILGGKNHYHYQSYGSTFTFFTSQNPAMFTMTPGWSFCTHSIQLVYLLEKMSSIVIMCSNSLTFMPPYLSVHVLGTLCIWLS